jgi:cytochrome c5
MKQWLTLVVVMSLASFANAAMDDKSIRERTKPVGSVCLEGEECGAAAAAAASGPKSPEDIYKGSCAGCHASGVMSAPKLGDAAAWGERMKKGLEQLQANAISGVNAMPPKGTCGTCSDDDIRAVVEYIVENSK